MSFWQKIVGDKAKSPAEMTASEVQTALAKLRAERDAAEQIIATAFQRRQSALAADATDTELAKIERERDAAELTVERADALEGKLLDRLRELQDKTRRELFDALLGSFRERESQLDAAIASVIAPLADYMEAVRQIDAAGFAVQASSMIARPPLHGIDGVLASKLTLEYWRRGREALQDRRAAFAARPMNPLPPPAPAKIVPMARKEQPGPHNSGWTKRAPKTLNGPIPRGYQRLQCCLNNVSYVDRMLVAGDEIDCLIEEAAHLLSGAAFRLIGIPEKIDKAAQ